MKPVTAQPSFRCMCSWSLSSRNVPFIWIHNQLIIYVHFWRSLLTENFFTLMKFEMSYFHLVIFYSVSPSCQLIGRAVPGDRGLLNQSHVSPRQSSGVDAACQSPRATCIASRWWALKPEEKTQRGLYNPRHSASLWLVQWCLCLPSGRPAAWRQTQKRLKTSRNLQKQLF